MTKHLVCIKHGKKYNSEYVNTLAKMVRRHLSHEIKLHCYTDDPTGIDHGINIIPLTVDPSYGEFLYKVHLFRPNFIEEAGTILYMDLDVVVFKSINKLFEYRPDMFCIIKDFDCRRNGRSGFNSSVFRFENGTNHHIYTDFMKVGAEKVRKVFPGDQEWIEYRSREFAYWPSEWMLSYKWEMQDPYSLDACIAVFHGNPKPHEINDEWVKSHWR